MKPNAIKKLAIRCSAHLQQEEHVLRETLRIVEETRESLLHRDGERLEKNVDEQRRILHAAESMRNQREGVRGEIAMLLEVPPDTATVSSLVQIAPDPIRSDLRDSRKRLRKLAARVRTMHRTNAVLALQTNRVVGEALHRIIGMQVVNTGYARKGLQKLSSTPALVDTDT